MRVIGLDIGGANLKASDGERRSFSLPFAIWREPERLGERLQQLLGQFVRPHHLAVTMTAELADCFATKATGVDRILSAVEAAVDVPVHVWQRGGEFVSPDDARELWSFVAAGNWHALSTWAGRMTPQGTALLIDIGSTSTDIIPLVDGLPEVNGGSDIDRLLSGTLVYTGLRRTPVCACVQSVPFGSSEIPLAAELFATMHDARIVLGSVAEEPDSCDTADGRPATIAHARDRLARMICCDRTEVDDNALDNIARSVCEAQKSRISAAVLRVIEGLPESPMSLLMCGEGEVVAREVTSALPSLAGSEVISLNDALGPQHSTAACAYALAHLGSERIR